MPAKKMRSSPEGTEKLKAEPLIEQEFELGVRVEAKWNGRYYPASVHRFDKGRYEVAWDDDGGWDNWVPADSSEAGARPSRGVVMCYVASPCGPCCSGCSSYVAGVAPEAEASYVAGPPRPSPAAC